jgi:branched-chain amino acid transport system ATP-binding protein
MLTVSNLHAGYGAADVLRGISFEVRQGEVVTLIGANGAGKTTTLMCVSGIVPVRAGSITFMGQDLGQLKAHEIVSRGLVQSPEGRKIFARMTVRENLDLGAFLRRDKAGIQKDIDHVFGLFPILERRQSQAAGTLSGGEQQMLAVGRAMLTQPKLLVLDEPSLGLAPLIVKRIFEVISQLNRDGMTILLVEQNAHMALQAAHRGYVMETGEITMSDSAQALLSDPRVRQAYLGD